MRLYTKLLLGFGSLWSVFLLTTVVLLTFLHQQGASLQDAFRSNFDSVVFCGETTAAFDSMNQLAMNCMWAHTPLDTTSLKSAKDRYAAGADGQSHNITLPGEAELTAAPFASGIDYQRAIDEFAAAPEARRVGLYQAETRPRYLTVRAASLAINKLNFDHLRKVNARLQQNLSRARLLLIIFVLTGGVLAIAGVIVLAKTILGPLRSLTQSVRQVEAGDLDLHVPVRAPDELGDLALAFNAMAARLDEYRQLDQSRLQRTMQTTQLAIDSLPDAVVVLNPQGRVEISNRQARLHFGLMPDDTQALPEWVCELVSGPLTTGQPVEPQGYESAVQLFDRGEERFLLPRAEAMFAEGGGVIGVVVTLVDVTGLRRAHEFKSGLLAAVSHELKTPLAAARFSVHLLAQETVAPLDDRQRRLIRAACEGTDRLHHIIENILQFQRFEEGRQQLKPANVAPETIINQAVGAFRDEFAQHGLNLEVDVQPNLPLVSADSDLIGHVMANLLSNALKFVPSSGHVKIAAALVHREVCFRIEDDGPGIASEHLPKLFTRFYRAATPVGVPGAGLGLFISRQLIEAQGGRISVDSVAGGGSRFTFTLPMVQD